MESTLLSAIAETETPMTYFKFLAVFAIASTEAFADQGSRRVVISLADRKLALIENGRTVRIYSVAVGKPGTPSPVGTFQVISRLANPTWYGPHKVVRPGPANPLGTRWMGLSHKGYGIHGTNVPRSIGKPASHGCIRMRRQDIEELFEQVQVGDQVELVKEASGELANIFRPLDSGSKVVAAAIPGEKSAAVEATMSSGGGQ